MNEDLIGFKYADLEVTGVAAWNPAYVQVTDARGNKSVRVAAQVRRLKEVTSANT